MTPVILDPLDYWRLRTLSADLERDQMQHALTEQRLAVSRVKRQALWAELAEQYGLDASRPYSARDEDCSLTEA